LTSYAKKSWSHYWLSSVTLEVPVTEPTLKKATLSEPETLKYSTVNAGKINEAELAVGPDEISTKASTVATILSAVVCALIAFEAADDVPTATVWVAPGLNVVGLFIFFPY